jgi:anti-sigma B factor antagonist
LEDKVMSKLNFEVYDLGDVKVIAFKGEIVMGSGDLAVKNQIKKFLELGVTKIVIDMGAVPYVDSTGIGELVAAHVSARTKGARVKMANLTNKMQDLMDVMQLASVFESHDSVEEAAKSF